MNNPFWLISEVRRKGGTLVFSDGALEYRGPQEVLTDELLEAFAGMEARLDKNPGWLSVLSHGGPAFGL